MKTSDFVIYNVNGILYRGMIQDVTKTGIKISGLGLVSKKSAIKNFELVKQMEYSVFVIPRDEQGYTQDQYKDLLNSLPRYTSNTLSTK